jgi:RES domain-containing protein
MVLWRISNYCELSGFGAETFSGRWHTAGAGKRIVYLAEHPALALIETLVNLKARSKTLSEHYRLLKVVMIGDPESAHVKESDLSPEWRTSWLETQPIGDAWLTSRSSALLAVPSSPSPESTNYLLNPLHPDAAGCKIEWCRRISYDQRLFGFAER